MCGIYAYLKKGQFSATDTNKIHQTFHQLKHRGPDHTSCIAFAEDEHSAFLGFHRLSIVDPTSKSNSILSTDNHWMCCNGEIYNYKHLIEKYDLHDKTGSDCEVILQLYKKYPNRILEIVRELDGVFAFVIFDNVSKRMIVGRDYYGVRPLFIGNDGESMSFTSEGKVNPFSNCRQFPPGKLMTIDLATLTHRLAEWRHSRQNIFLNFDLSKPMIHSLLKNAVEKRMHPDRPMGFLLSGGLDSSIIASIANELSDDTIRTFSIGFADSPDLISARVMAQHLGSDHKEVIIEDQHILDAIEPVVKTLETYDITTIRASIPMFLLSRYISENTDVRVLFSGEGADELFGGYLYFHNAPDYHSFSQETERLLDELYMMDVLRADRTTSAWGLELRVPFLDITFSQFVRGLSPELKMPSQYKIEKHILRQAFMDYLPLEISGRQKEAFSDGVGSQSVMLLKQKAEDYVIKHRHNGRGQHPMTKEGEMYYDIFAEYYENKPGLLTKQYWLPRWTGDDFIDPSATVLSMHKNNLEHK